jgi:hypothetical protein
VTPEEARRHEAADLRNTIAVAEIELEALSRRAREAYQVYRDLDRQQNVKGCDLREFRRKLATLAGISVVAEEGAWP